MLETDIADLYKLLLALVMGALIGAEREYRSKSAGLRTIMLICLGSTLFTILSLKIGLSSPDRIAANIITGIGFIGAGVVFKDGNSVTGLTTAATIWVAAAVGIGIGAGYPVISFFATVFTIVILFFLIKIQNYIGSFNLMREYKIVCAFKQETLLAYEKIFKEYNLEAYRGKQCRVGDEIIGTWSVHGNIKNHELLVNRLLADRGIKEFYF
jgi:putative Mg2+ transporter-C (MgtC) family protein